VTLPFRMTLGYFCEGTDAGLPETLFGHDGWGGSMVFADPEARMSIGYVMNQMGTTPRWSSLATAAYRALGDRQGKFGVWLR
jgi:CubicO group peptidase (beta-lactamase class C family)